jgi:hypothetical protein
VDYGGLTMVNNDENHGYLVDGSCWFPKSQCQRVKAKEFQIHETLGSSDRTAVTLPWPSVVT